MTPYPVGGGAYPMAGKAYPMGVPSPSASPQPPSAPAAPSAPMASPGLMAAMGQVPVGAAPQIQAPQPAFPPTDRLQMPVGQNGFGVHPETTPAQMVDYLLPKFRDVESSHDPTNYIGKKDKLPYDPKRGTASGYYGYTDDTWGHYKGYPRAMDAPPNIQDERMKADLAQSLAKHGNDPYKAVANHYYPAHARDPTKWDNPIPDKYGKPSKAMTVNQYVQRILPQERVAKYLQGVNPSRPGGNDQASLQLP